MLKKTKISKFGLQILRKMRGGQKLKKVDSGSFVVGSVNVPGSVFNILAAADFLKSDSKPNCFVISEPGLKYLKRVEGLRALKSANTGVSISAERLQHQSFLLERQKTGGGRKQLLRNINDNPLSWLKNRKGKGGKPLISERQYLAGQRLSMDFEKASLRQKVTQIFDGIPVSKSRKTGPNILHETENHIHARRRLEKALTSVGPGLKDVLVDICCFEKSIGDVETSREWPRRSGKLILSIALEQLADHYEGKKK